MTIINGDCGGIIFRADSAGNFYLFEVCQDGYYSLSLPGDNTLTSSPGQTIINQGLSQTNLVAVIASGDTITLYVNNQPIDSFNDSTYSNGYIGVTANALNTPTEVAYSNARVWTL